MDTIKPKPLYLIGDLVKCTYDLYQYYYPVYPTAKDNEPSNYGIIIEVDYATYGEFYGFEPLYLVLCIDGIKRYYCEDEIIKIG